DYRDAACQGGGEFIDPQWVTCYPCEGLGCYRRVEGKVHTSHVTYSDDPQNHDSHDHDFTVHPDPPCRYLVSTRPEDPEAPTRRGRELERDHSPEFMRPTPGNRVSAFGYWIFDCGPPPFYTEIHPIVGLAVHREAAVEIPADKQFAYFNDFG